jgi:hypothetical protein
MSGSINPDRLPPYLAYGWLDRWSILETDGGAIEVVYVDGEDIAYRVHWAPHDCRLIEYLDGMEIGSALGLDLKGALFELGGAQLADEPHGPPPLYTRMQRHMANRLVMDKPRLIDTRYMFFPALLLAWVTLFVPDGTEIPVPRVPEIPLSQDQKRSLDALAPDSVREAARLTYQLDASIAVERGQLVSWNRPVLMVEELLDALGDFAERDRPSLEQPHSAFYGGHLNIVWFIEDQPGLAAAAWAVASEDLNLDQAIESTARELPWFAHDYLRRRANAIASLRR